MRKNKKSISFPTANGARQVTFSSTMWQTAFKNTKEGILKHASQGALGIWINLPVMLPKGGHIDFKKMLEELGYKCAFEDEKLFISWSDEAPNAQGE